MRKINIVLIALFVFLISTNCVSAMTLKPSGPSTGQRKEELILYLTLEKGSDEKQISAVDGTFSYDPNVLTLVDSTMLREKWTEFMLINNNQVFSYANLSFDNLISKTKENIIKISFKINEKAAFGNTKVSITNPSATDEEGNGVSINGGTHTIKILSNINTLSNIKVEGANIDFKENTNNYNLTIDAPTTTIEIAKKDSSSTITGDVGTLNLNYGLNTFSIIVKSESGLKRTYTLNINRPDNRSKENSLSSLKISDAEIKFNKEKLNYNITVNNNVSNIKLEATLTDNKSSFVENYGPRIVNLNVGQNKIEIKVKAENEEIKTYTVNVVRSEKDSLEDKDITENKQTGNLWIIPVIVISILSIILVMFIVIKKKK